MALSLEQLLEYGTGLVSLPAIAIRLNKMVDDPGTTAADIGKLISQDPALTMRLLQVANGSFYGLSSRVDTIARAVTVLGTRQVRDLVLATSVTKAFSGVPNQLMTMEEFWRHSLYVGLAARLLASHLQRRDSEALFTAGLLHDVGRLLIFNQEPVLAHQAFVHGLTQPAGFDSPVLAEREVLGYDHAEVGWALAARWKLPERLQECIRYHHHPMHATDFSVEVAIVHIANTIAHMAELDTQDPRDAPPVHPVAWERTGLSVSMLSEIIESAQQQVVELESLILAA